MSIINNYFIQKAVNRLLIMLISHFVLLNANAQFFEKNDLYASGEIAIGNYLEMNLNMNLVIDGKYSLQIGGSSHIREAKSQPVDYNSGITGILTLGFSQLHFDHMDNYQILFGRIYNANESGNIRFNLAGGIGYTIIKEPTNWEPVSGFTLGPNYTYDIEKHSTISLIFNPKVEFPLSRIIGLTVSPMLQINIDRVFVGIGVGTMIGLLRKKIN